MCQVFLHFLDKYNILKIHDLISKNINLIFLSVDIFYTDNRFNKADSRTIGYIFNKIS